MKIIKQGEVKRKLKPLQFECRECGCVFEADNTEYKFSHADLYPGELDDEEILVYYCLCPTCDSKVYVRE